MKKCAHCKELKDINDFTCLTKSIDGKSNRCKICNTNSAKEYYLNKVRILKNDPTYKIEKKSFDIEKSKEKMRNYNKYKRNTDNFFKLKSNIRSMIYNSFKRACKGTYIKSEKTELLLGCNFDFFINYLFINFQDGMSFENHGEWHIDHIVPLAKCKTKEEIIKCCHYTNLQPLWAIDNLKKGAK